MEEMKHPGQQPGFGANEYQQEQGLSHLALWSMILGILGFCLPLFALPALIMGIVGITKTGAGKKSGQGFAITGTVLGALGMIGSCLWIGIMLPAVGKARQTAMMLKSSTQLRSIGQGMSVYASSNNDQFPPVDQTFDILIDQGLIEPDLLISPLEDGDGVSYILTGVRQQTFDGSIIIAYEDPKHWDAGVNVLFGDNTVRLIDHAELEAALAAQEAFLNNTQP